MFAGAAREAVFSRTNIIRQVNREFIPVALKAALVNDPPPGPEGELLREIARSRPAPQGICVANPAGKVLAWTLSFENDTAVARYLDHARGRYRQYPDASQPVPAQRFMRFPDHPLPDVPDTRASLPPVRAHGKDAWCPASPPRARGTVVARVVGRAVRADGSLASECQRQERYVEDLFDVPPPLQAELAGVLATGGRVRLPERLARHLVTYAYLGQLDVRPVSSPVPGSRSVEHAIEFWIEPDGVAQGSARPSRIRPTRVKRFRLTGRSDVEISSPRRQGDGASYFHRVTLDWEGFVSLEGERLTELLLYAEGRERLRWQNPAFATASSVEDVARLPAGRPLDVDTAVRYGVIGTPISDAQAWKGEGPAPAAPGTGTPPPPALVRKVQRLQERMQRWQAEGRDPREIARTMERFGPLMRDSRFAEAEKLLDEALARAAEAR